MLTHGAREVTKAEVDDPSQQTPVNDSHMDTTLITVSQKTYIRIDQKYMYLLY